MTTPAQVALREASPYLLVHDFCGRASLRKERETSFIRFCLFATWRTSLSLLSAGNSWFGAINDNKYEEF